MAVQASIGFLPPPPEDIVLELPVVSAVGSVAALSADLGGGPPAGGATFVSDWGTATGTTDAALRDTDKTIPWTVKVDPTDPNLEVVAASGESLTTVAATLAAQGWPHANALKSTFTTTTSGTLQVLDQWPHWTPGQYFFIRFYFVHDGADGNGGSEWGGNHSPQFIGGLNCPGVWSFNHGNLGDNGAQNGTFRVTYSYTNTSDSNQNRRFDLGGWDETRGHGSHSTTVLTKGKVYRYELRMQYVSTNVQRWEVRIYNITDDGEDGSPVYVTSDFIHRFGSFPNLSGADIEYNDTQITNECQRGWAVGVGGQGGVPTGTVTYTGGVFLLQTTNADAWPGKYVDGEGT